VVLIAVIGQAEIRIRPLTTGFAADLQRQILPQLTQVETGFSKTISAGATRAAAAAAPAVKKAGVASGRTFSTGFGEGFAALAAFAIGARVARAFRETAQEFLTFEVAFAGVRRVVRGSPEEIGALEGKIRDLAQVLPFSAAEIANVAQQAAQLGVATADIEGFTETVLKLGATTDLSTEQAATGLARLGAVLQLPLSGIEALASALVELGNTSGVTESEILDLGQSLAGVAIPLGLTADQVLGLAAGIRRVGGDFEAGASATTRAIDIIQQAVRTGNDDLTTLLETTGLARDEFKALAKEDPGRAFVAFLAGLQAAGERQIDVLDDLGLGAVRFTRELRKQASGVQFVAENLDNANRGFAEANALNKEFGIFAGLSANKIQMLKNRIDDMQISLGRGLVPVLEKVLQGFAALSPLTVAFGGLTAGIVTLGFAAGRFVNIFKALESGLRSLPFFTKQAAAATLELAAAETTAAASGNILAATNARTSASMVELNRAGKVAAIGIKGLGIAAVIGAAIDILGAALDGLSNKFDSVADGGKFSTQILEQLEQTSGDAGKAFERLGLDIERNFATAPSTFDKLRLSLQGLLPDELLENIPLIGGAFTSELTIATRNLEPFANALTAVVEKLGPEAGAGIRDAAEAALLLAGNSQRVVDEGLKPFDEALAAAQTEAANATIVTRILGDAAVAMGKGVFNAAGNLIEFADAASLAESALSAFDKVSADYDQAVASFIPTFGEYVNTTRQSGAASRAAGNAAEEAAEKIADAERALAEAKEDAADRIADAERELAQTQEDAADRVIEAQRRLQEIRRQGTRGFRDAQQELQDFQAALARAGGAQTPEDLIRLRELREAARDARTDARAASREGEQDLASIEEENAERIAEARRKVVEAEEEAAERIAEARRRLAEAIEDANKRTAAGADAAADSIIRTSQTLIDTLQTNANDLDTFANLINRIDDDILSVFGEDLGEAFLARLVELGPAGIPLLRDLARRIEEDPNGIRRLAKIFAKAVDASKAAADLRFDKFPDNFREKAEAASQDFAEGLDPILVKYDNIADETDATTQNLEADLIARVRVFQAEVEANLASLTAHEETLLASVTDSSLTATTRLDKLKLLIESIKGRNLNFPVELEITKKDREILDGLADLGFGKEASLQILVTGGPGRATGGTVLPAQFGRTSRVGESLLVGERGRELFIPNQAGAIFRHTDTERILRALAGVSGGGVVNNVTVNEVAQDPRATARAVAFAIGKGAIR